jgi:hypothetical protein
VAGDGGEQDAHEKKCAKQDTGFGGDMQERAARGHENSPQIIIRNEKGGDFRAWYRECFEKNWPDGQGWELKVEI